MRIVFVHGINNQGRSSRQIVDEWLRALSRTISPSDMIRIKECDIVAPYYGDILHEATVSKSHAGEQPLAMGLAEAPREEAQFYLDALRDMAPAAGIGDADVRAQEARSEPLEQGFPHDRRLLSVVRALERLSPLHGRLILRFLPQAFVYLRRAHVTQAIDAEVGPYLAEKCIVIAHSLGSVVTFKQSRQLDEAHVPLFVTLGSPLAVKAVQNAIGPAFGRQDSVSKWSNFADRNDAVTIGRILDAFTFGEGIDNYGDVRNGSDDPHSVAEYLSDRRVGLAILAALGAPIQSSRSQ
ncbi:hypothetical protein JQ543_23495 [Bradyrhizobium diazoefficiens]|nr:hypothetical protein [Bradyrhizobium diazoefficiens]MBR0850726.1 hypothetical protein [Bradyrhizobium diazoefficiens]